MVAFRRREICEIYNQSEYDAIEYITKHDFTESEEYRQLARRMLYLNKETEIGWGDKPCTAEERTEYSSGMKKLFDYYGICFDYMGRAWLKNNT